MQLFGLVRKNMPHVLEKLIPVNGDVMELDLGLSPDDIIRMKNVSIIFHSAASVKFDDPVKYAVFMNTRGTREMMKFAEKLPNLKVCLHVSTTYTNLKETNVREEIYPEVADWQKTIEMCEKLDEDILDVMTQHYSDFIANTYVFSKNLAEHVIDDYKDKVPVVLFRPSIVISTMAEVSDVISNCGALFST
jgi:fatty acyl-CoA reductase